MFPILSPFDNVLLSSTLVSTLHLVYIDDLVIVGYDFTTVKSLVERVRSAYEAVGMKVNVKKSVPPSQLDVKVIGVQLNGLQQRMFVDGLDLISLISRTRLLLNAGTCTGNEMSIMIGHWCWYLLINRPLLSILNNCYKFIQVFKSYTHVKKALWSSVQRELALLCCLAPLLQMDLSTVVSNRVVATDASMTGYGVMSNRMSEQNSQVDGWLNQLCSHVGLNTFECKSSNFLGTGTVASMIDSITLPYQSDQPVICLTNSNRHQHTIQIAALVVQLVEHVDWVTIMSGCWRFNDESTHINQLELSSVLLAVRWLSSLLTIRSRGRKVIMLVDNAVTKYVVMKGRSSSSPLLKLLRRITTVCIAMEIKLKLVYVSSELNPADAASRTGTKLISPNSIIK
jgi:hypothetical protein